jgi:acyl-coenzyme A thioesterase 9
MHPERQPENVINMSDTLLHSTMIMQPEDRNRHNFMIFGGFLLKQSFELAFTCAASFSHSRPIFVSLDPSTFLNPVPVGSVLYLRAIVSYTDPPILGESAQKWDPKKSSSSSETLPRKYTQVQVRVDSKVRNVEHGEKKSTGVFNYTFLVPKEIQVMPKTYGEFMMWIDARRRAEGIDPIVEARVTENGRSGKMTKGVTE